MEVFGFVSAVAASLEQAIAAAERLKDRCEYYKTNPDQITDLLAKYRSHARQLGPLRINSQDSCCIFPPPYDELFTSKIQDLDRSIVNAVTELKAAARRLDSKRYRFMRAKKVAALLVDLKQSANHVELLVGQLVGFFANAVVHSQSERSFGSTPTSTSSLVTLQPDEFRAVLDGKAVPTNPPHVILDLMSTDAKGEGLTLEGKLKRAVLDDVTSSDVSAVGSAHAASVSGTGMGGVGKSCALRGLAQDPEILARFKDGVYYLSLGKDATLTKIIQQICDVIYYSGGKQLARELREEDRLDTVVMKARLWFAGKACLLLIDDVWEENDVGCGTIARLSSLVDNTAGGRVAFTTRDRRMCQQSTAVYFAPRDPFGNVSRGILLNAAGCSENQVRDEPYRSVFEEILGTCGGLPMALAVAGSAVGVMKTHFTERPLDAWSWYMSALRSKDETLLRNTVTNDQYPNLTVAFLASLRTLDEYQRPKLPFYIPLSFHEMYRALSVVPKQTWAPTNMLQRLWRLGSDHEAVVVARHMSNTSLLDFDLHRKAVRLHDLVLDFAREESQKLNETRKWHATLLDGYIPRRGDNVFLSDFCREWYGRDIVGDEYMRVNVCRHLASAGLTSELLNLLMKPQWVGAQLELNGILMLESDYKLAFELLQQDADSSDPNGLVWSLRAVVGAARLSASFVSKNPGEVWFQLRGRLLAAADISAPVDAFLKELDVCAIQPWVRPLSTCFPGPGGALERTFLCDGSPEWVTVLNDDVVVICGLSNGIPFGIQLSGHDAVRYSLDDEEPSEGTDSEPPGVSVSELLGSSTCVTSSKDGRLIAVGSMNGNVLVTTLSREGSTTLCWRHENHGKVRCLAFSMDGNVLVSGAGKTLRAWNTATGVEVCSVLEGHTSNVMCVAMSEDGSKIASGSEDGTIRIWSVETGEQEGVTLCGDERAVRCLAFCKGGARIVSGSNDRSVRVWDVKGFIQVEPPLLGHARSVGCLSISSDGNMIASGGEDGSIRIWDAECMRQVGNALRAHTSRVMCVSFASDDKQVISASDDGTVRWFSVRNVTELGKNQKGHDSRVKCAAVSKDGKRIVTGGEDKTVRVWNVETGKQVGCALTGHTGWVYCAEFRDDGERIVSGSNDRTVRQWDAKNMMEVGLPLKGHTSVIRCAVYSRSGKRIASVSDDRSVRVWNAETGAQICKTLEGHKNWIRFVSFSMDESMVVTGGEDLMVRVWSVESGDDVYEPFVGHTQRVTCGTFSPDGKYVATGSADKSVIVWDIEKRQQRGDPLVAHEGWVTCVGFSRDGSKIVSGSDMSCVQWDFDTGTQLRTDDSFTGSELARHRFLSNSDGTALDASSDHSGLRFSSNAISYESSAQREVLATLESKAKWTYLRESKTILAIPDVGLYLFKLAMD